MQDLQDCAGNRPGALYKLQYCITILENRQGIITRTAATRPGGGYIYTKEYIQEIHSNARKNLQKNLQNPHTGGAKRPRPGRRPGCVDFVDFFVDFSLRCCVFPGYIP